MTLTLKDLIVSTDVGTPAPRAAAAPSSASSDPFAAFFNTAATHDTMPKTASHDSQAASSSSQSTASTAKDSHANRTDNTRDHDGNESAAHVHHKSPSDSTASASAPNSPSADQRKPTSDADATDSANPSPTTTANDAPDAPINLFQVTLLAAQAVANDPVGGSTVTTPQTPATPAVGSVTTDPASASGTAVSALPMSATDMAALLAGQDNATIQDNATALPASTAVQTDPNIQENIPPTQTPAAPSAPTTGDIAILGMATSPSEQVANAVVPMPPRPTDSRGAPTPTQTPSGSSTRTPGTSRSQTDDLAKADTAPPPPSTPNSSAATPTDPAVVPFVPTSADNTSPSPDDTASQPDNAVDNTVASSVVTTGIATPQQVQTLYAKTASRIDSLPQVTIDQVAMHLTKAADDGLDHLTIHLKPAELGSIEVKLEMGDNGISKTTISADRPDTLNLLQRDSHRLEQALENAGLKTDPGSLSFNLRGDGGRYSPNFSQGNGSTYSPYARNTADDAAPPVNPAILGYINSRAALGGIDIRV